MGAIGGGEKSITAVRTRQSSPVRYRIACVSSFISMRSELAGGCVLEEWDEFLEGRIQFLAR